MGIMFAGATSFNGNISTWNVSKVTNMGDMFGGASNFNQPLNNWNVSSVTDMNYMFAGATSFNGNISSWNVSSVTDMGSMFSGVTSFNQPLNNWNVSSVTYMGSMFDGASLSISNYNALLIGWASLSSLQSGVYFGGNNSHYSSSAVNAREKLIKNYGWIISDAGLSNISNKIPLTNNSLTNISNKTPLTNDSLINNSLEKVSLEGGFSKVIYNGEEILFDVGNESHSFKVKNVTDSTAEIILSSTPQKATFSIGQEKRFNLNGDNYYDIFIKLNSIEVLGGDGANFTIRKIHEKIIPSSEGNKTSANNSNKIISKSKFNGGDNSYLFWIFIAVILLFGVLFFSWLIYELRNKRE